MTHFKGTTILKMADEKRRQQQIWQLASEDEKQEEFNNIIILKDQMPNLTFMRKFSVLESYEAWVISHFLYDLLHLKKDCVVLG